VLLSARRVGPTGKAYGLDMTDKMQVLAEENKRKSGLTNSKIDLSAPDFGLGFRSADDR
jgi:hypothetical protein